MALTTKANENWVWSIGPDLIAGTADDYFDCTGTTEPWVTLGYFDASLTTNPLAPDGTTSGSCVKQVKKNGGSTGKTQFCDISDQFLVDVDLDLDNNGIFETSREDEFVFSIRTCNDDPLTTTINEAQFCLSGIVWDIDEGATDIKATAQIFVSHDPRVDVQINRGNIK